MADGSARKFVYDRPRPGLAANGVKKGTVLFEGERQGPTYKGRAYVFTARCGKVAYQVAGTVADDERSVTLEGFAPVLSQGCKRSGMRRDRLVFELTP